MLLIINKTDKTFVFQDKLYGTLTANQVKVDNQTPPDDLSLYRVNATDDGIELNLQAIEDAKPKVVTKRKAMQQMKATLTQEDTSTMWLDLQVILSADQDAKDEWDLSSELDIADPVLIAMATALGLDSEGLQEFFVLASER